MTHERGVLEMLRRKPVTHLMAWTELGNSRLADSIYKLRGKGFKIDTYIKPFTTARGVEVKFAEYHLIKEPRGKC
jgi:hypothetical protein